MQNGTTRRPSNEINPVRYPISSSGEIPTTSAGARLTCALDGNPSTTAKTMIAAFPAAGIHSPSTTTPARKSHRQRCYTPGPDRSTPPLISAQQAPRVKYHNHVPRQRSTHPRIHRLHINIIDRGKHPKRQTHKPQHQKHHLVMDRCYTKLEFSCPISLSFSLIRQFHRIYEISISWMVVELPSAPSEDAILINVEHLFSGIVNW
jgi:hypothetical protein